MVRIHTTNNKNNNERRLSLIISLILLFFIVAFLYEDLPSLKQFLPTSSNNQYQSSRIITSSSISTTTTTTQKNHHNHNNESPSSQHLHPLTVEILSKSKSSNVPKMFIYELRKGKGQGLGSTTIWLCLMSMYFNDIQNRSLTIIDESHSTQYRYNKTHGLYSGFFNLGRNNNKIIVIDNHTTEYTRVRNELTTAAAASHKNFDFDLSSINYVNDTHNTIGESSKFYNNWQWMDPQFFSNPHETHISNTYNTSILKVTQYHYNNHRGSLLWHIQLTRKILNYYNHSAMNGRATIGPMGGTTQDIVLFQRLSNFVCENIHYSQSTKQYITKIFQQSNIPIKSPSFSIITSGYNNNGHNNGKQKQKQKQQKQQLDKDSFLSVAFHIRRGNKVTMKESIAYGVYEYIEKLIRVVDNDVLISKIKYCYLATDDKNVIDEMYVALESYSQTTELSCSLHTLKKIDDDDDDDDDNDNDNNNNVNNNELLKDRNKANTLFFLSELQLLIEADYFIGTFNSNVGSLVALYRGCERGERERGQRRLLRQRQQQQQPQPQPQPQPQHRDSGGDGEGGDDNNGNNKHHHQQQHHRFFFKGFFFGRRDDYDDDDDNDNDYGTVENKYHHYYHSYGVDNEDWYIVR